MKNSYKDNSSRKSSRKYKKDSNSNFYSKNRNSSKKNNRFPINAGKNISDNNLIESDKSKGNFSSLSRRKSMSENNIEVYKKAPEFFQNHENKKNFDDWIWGKHSVFEALISERAINRIWCTSEIFSSEKFYILLKGLKSKVF